MPASRAEQDSLKILHVLRAPLGGLFRHVLDLTREQVARGHRVGLVTDSLTGGERAEQVLRELEADLALGVLRLPIHRNPHVTDMANMNRIHAHCASLDPDVIHGHGSKGGVYARMPALMPGAGPAIRAYTPHGGSFNYRPGSMIHRLYMQAEAMLARGTDLFLFESAYIAGCYERFVGKPRGLARVVVNGISDAEFEPVAPAPDAADFFYIGELRSAKGIDTFIDAIALYAQSTGVRPDVVLIGSGPDQQTLTAHAASRGLADKITFPGAMAAREAFRKGKVMVVPSRAESLPYVVLEAAGARVPMVATNVGGIPEIFGPHADRLIACDNPQALADAMLAIMNMPVAQRNRQAKELGSYVAGTFHLTDMADAVIANYREALAGKAAASSPAAAPEAA